jgi:L-histidine N-alpha-methyltransferase
MKHLTALPGEGNRLICFFGSTLGNLTRQQAISFLMEIKTLMKPGDQFLLGLDMVKDIDIIEAAYNDQQGFTSLFNKNILRVTNDYAQTDFDTRLFEHIAFYNAGKARIEMHLMATADMVVKSEFFPQRIFLKKGETIHSENSHKFTTTDIQNFASVTGLNIEKIYTDINLWFSLVNFKCIE